MLRDILPGPAWAPYSSGVPVRSRNDELNEEQIDDRQNFARGMLIAVALEAVLAFGVYEGWRAWHLLGH